MSFNINASILGQHQQSIRWPTKYTFKNHAPVLNTQCERKNGQNVFFRNIHVIFSNLGTSFYDF
jgi:hypothetical protein